MSPELAELLGIYMADGCISTNGRIVFTVEKKDEELKKRIIELMHELFGLKLGMEEEKKDDNSISLTFYSRDLCRIFEKLGWKKESSSKAFVPSHILESSPDSARAFIRGLFEGDGDVHEDGYPRLYSTSERLVKEIQQILFALGIVSFIHKYERKGNSFGDKPLYRLVVVQERGMKKFAKDIGFITKRKNEKLRRRMHEKAFETSDIIPHQEGLLREIYEKTKSKRIYRDVWHYMEGIKDTRNLTRKRLKELLIKYKELRHPQLLDAVDDMYFYSRVKEIRKERAYTMDIMVPTEEHFVANSILVHNKRRGANMGILRIDHPDILDFITSKDSENRILTNFNISVAITDKFMKALENNEEFDLVNPRTGQVVKRLFARQIWEMITYQAWKTGDPGVIFIDEINRHNQTPHIGEIESTNPCGEQPLLPFESCNLGSINLSKVVIEKDGKPEIDWEKLKRVTRTAVRFLDNVIDANKFPLKQIEFMSHANRKIGLGVMGFADMLIKLGIRYDSEEALKLGEKVMKFVTQAGREMSVELGKERGNFPNFKGSIWDKKGYKHMRNATVTTIAPTGTISIISDCSSGIEPLFAVAFVRKNVLGGEEELVEVNKLFEKYAKEKGFYNEELMRKISETGSIVHIEGIPKEAKELFRTAHDIDYEWHVRMQAAFQKYTDNAVSKTINMRNDATIKDVENAYLLAHRLKCKGITIYRDRSKAVQVIHIGEKKSKRRKMIDVAREEKKELTESEEKCPVCGSKLYSAEGCYTCLSCGYSKCG